MREDKEKTVGYEVSRFNAVKHGILSKETLLPHENAEDYQMLLNALESEYSPEGISEQALVEELAGVLWRKRRLLLAEGAKINEGINNQMTYPVRVVNTAVPFSLHVSVSEFSETEIPIREFMKLSDDEVRQRRNELLLTREQIVSVQNRLRAGGRGTAKEALRLLPEIAENIWYAEDRSETIYSVERFIENELMPYLDREEALLNNIDGMRQQMLGNAVSQLPFESLARYEAHLDRKFERTLSILLKLKALKNSSQESCPAPEK